MTPWLSVDAIAVYLGMERGTVCRSCGREPTPAHKTERRSNVVCGAIDKWATLRRRGRNDKSG